jgi:hypothetical protein
MNGLAIRCRTNEAASGCRAVARNASKTSLPEPELTDSRYRVRKSKKRFKRAGAGLSDEA